MLIGIDASRSNVKQRTGTEYYSYEIIKNLIRDSSNKYRLYSKTPLDYVASNETIENKVMEFPRLWSQIRLSFEIYKNPPDVLFVPAHTIPVYHGKKTVATLHDIGFRYFPELYTPLERYYHNYCMAFSVKHATKIIAISQSTKKDLIKFYNAEEDKISVIYHGYTKEKFHPLKRDEKIPDDIKNLQPYLFFIGRLEAKKNLVNLIKAFGELKKDSSIKHKLVLAGRPGYQYEEIKEQINKLEEHSRANIVELGYVEDEKVSWLTRCADIFVFPSYFEGFGMPLLETMASGVPIVASNTTSIPEIVSGAAILKNPNDFRGFAEAVESIIKSSKIKNELIKKGLKRARDFSWERCAKETLEVIKEAKS